MLSQTRLRSELLLCYPMQAARSAARLGREGPLQCIAYCRAQCMATYRLMRVHHAARGLLPHDQTARPWRGKELCPVPTCPSCMSPQPSKQPRYCAGAFVGPDGKTLPVPENLPNAHMRLFGGLSTTAPWPNLGEQGA